MTNHHLHTNPQYPHSNLSSIILSCCFEVINELGVGYLESVYKNALLHSLTEKGLKVEIEKPFDVFFKGKKVGHYRADILVEKSVIVELKCCKKLLLEHQAQVINYLTTSNVPVGLLVNFNNKHLDYKRLQHPSFHLPNIEDFTTQQSYG